MKHSQETPCYDSVCYLTRSQAGRTEVMACAGVLKTFEIEILSRKNLVNGQYVPGPWVN